MPNFAIWVFEEKKEKLFTGFFKFMVVLRPLKGEISLNVVASWSFKGKTHSKDVDTKSQVTKRLVLC